MQRQKGFTLIELMIVVAVVAIISSIAYPSYRDQVLRTRRAAAAGCVMELAQFMERYYTTNMTYAGAVLPNTACRTDLNGLYTFGFNGNVTATSFVIQATPQGAQAQDTRCGTIGVNAAGARTESGTGTVSDCW